MAGLLGAPGRHRGRIEEQHHRTVLQQRGQPARRPVLIGQFEVGYMVAGIHRTHRNCGAVAARRSDERLLAHVCRAQPDPRRRACACRTAPRRVLRRRARPHRRRRQAVRSDVPLDDDDPVHRKRGRASRTFVDVIADRFHSVTLNGADVDVVRLPAAGRASRCPTCGRQRPRRRRRPAATRTPARGCTASSTRSTARPTCTRSSRPPTPSGCTPASTSPTSRPTFTLHGRRFPTTGRSRRTAARPATEQLRAGKIVHFATTPRISPYITALVAGPYHVVRDDARRHRPGPVVPLDAGAATSTPTSCSRSPSRASTGIHANFGMRYPFDKYDQLFVPEFNAGAMENAGCVTIAENYVFRSKVTDARRERRAETILHEMAHMWFGDLVTMRWWDDLWLNESFATYASVLCQTARDALDDGLDDVRQHREDLGLPAGPAALDAPDRDRRAGRADRRGQLRRHHLRQGRERAQAARCLRRHRRVPRRAARLLRASMRTATRRWPTCSARWRKRPDATSASGRSCGSRPQASTRCVRSSRWPPTARYASFEVVQSAPDEVADLEHAAPAPPGRSACTNGRTDASCAPSASSSTSPARARPSPELVGVAQPDLLLVNDDDLTYCKLRLDEHSIATLRAGGIAELDESLPRALLWSAAWDMTRDGELRDPRLPRARARRHRPARPTSASRSR